MNEPASDRLAGRLTLAPGSATPITCERPMVRAALMRRLTEGRRATLLPDLMGSVFALGATAQRATSRRAVEAAWGYPVVPPADAEMEALQLSLATAREHLQRFALDLPLLLPQPGVAADPKWLRDAPVMVAPAPGSNAAALRGTLGALSSWLERRLLGLPAAEWLRRWRAGPGPWLVEWSAGRDHGLARWLAAVRPRAQALRLPCRPLALLEAGEAGLRDLSAALADDPDLAEHPRWRGLPAETGPWTRYGRGDADTHDCDVWCRLGSRLADLAALSQGESLAVGAATLAPGEGIAWTEMSRGLLVHWIRLEPGRPPGEGSRAADYRVFAPTEWNFHPQGAFGQALAAGGLDTEDTRLTALALDPCVQFDVVERGHA